MTTNLNSERFRCVILEGNCRIVDEQVESSVVLLQKISQPLYTGVVIDVKLVKFGLQPFLKSNNSSKLYTYLLRWNIFELSNY